MDRSSALRITLRCAPRALLLFFASGIAQALPTARPQLPSNSLAIPRVVQATEYSCGAAAFLSVVYYWNVYDGNESSLYPRLGTTPQNGTENPPMVKLAHELGLKARIREDLTLADLRKILSRGETAILDIQAWPDKPTHWPTEWETGHYVVLVGMDDTYAYFMDPSSHRGYGYIELNELNDRWHDYEIVDGKSRRFNHSAVIIKGKQPMTIYPAAVEAIQ